MNLSKDGISTSAVKSYAIQITATLLAITSPVAFVCGFILAPLLPDNQILLVIVSIGIGFAITGYFFIRKVLSAFAVDVTKGITEELSNSHPNSY